MANPSQKRPLRKGAKSHYLVDKIDIVDGLSIVRTNKSGLIWSMSCYIPSAKRNFRKSLKTTDAEKARILAITEYVELKKRLERGENPFSTTAKDLVDSFLKTQEKRVHPDGRHSDGITPGRFGTIQIVLRNHFLKFVGAKTKLDEIPAAKFLDYYNYRRNKKNNVRKSTLRNERSLITGMYKFAVKAGFVPHSYAPEFPKIGANTQKYASKEDARDAFNADEWQRFYEHLMSLDEDAIDESDKYDRQVFRHFALIGANAGLRFGEMRKLKWSMVKVESEGGLTTVKIQVPAITKTGARPVQGARGELFEGLKALSSHTKGTDWVFVDQKTGEQFSRKTLYRLWAVAMKETGLGKAGKKLTFYSLRHTYCTFRLLSGTDIYLLARNMGTSVKFIEDHYGHVEVDLKKGELTRATGMDKNRDKMVETKAAMAIFGDRGSLMPPSVAPITIKLDPKKRPLMTLPRSLKG